MKIVSQYIAIGPNVWGKSDTAEEAIRKARREYGRKLADYDLFSVGPDTTVSGLGGFEYPHDGPKPQLVRKVRKGKLLPLD